MKQKSRFSSTFISLVLLVLAILCVTDLTYSYFSATTSKEGNIKFDTLNVGFVWVDSDGVTTEQIGNTSLKLYSASGPIQRETEFELSIVEGGKPIQAIGIQNFEGCDCLVRFWIDAYIVKDGVAQTDENYGKYFFLDDSVNTGSGLPVLTREDSSVSGSWCYFLTQTLTSFGAYDGIGNTLTLKNIPASGGRAESEVPVELLGQSLLITISLEAVQYANNAYLSVFGKAGDTKGYYTGWSELGEEW